MLSAIIERFLYPPRIPDDDLLNILPLQLYRNTSSFLSSHFESLLRLPNPHTAIHRYAVESITLLNNVLTPQHEHLCVKVSDTQRTPPDTTLLCIKCASTNEYNPEYFSEHSDSSNVLHAILSAIQDLSDLISPSVSPSSPQPLVKPSTSPTSQLTSSHTFYRSVTSVTGHNKKTYAPGQVLRQIKPKGLSLIELALIADIVHKQDRLYSLFDNQSYWYANLICDAVVTHYTCEQQDSRGATYSQDDVHIPPNDHLPKLAGQSMRIPVTDVEAVVLSVVLARFEEARTQQMDAFSKKVQKQADNVQKEADELRQSLAEYTARLDKIEEARTQQIEDEVQISPDEAESQRQLERALKDSQRTCMELLKMLQERHPSLMEQAN